MKFSEYWEIESNSATSSQARDIAQKAWIAAQQPNKDLRSNGFWLGIVWHLLFLSSSMLVLLALIGHHPILVVVGFVFMVVTGIRSLLCNHHTGGGCD